MKIAIVIDVYQDKGNGTSMSARHFVEQLRSRGHEVVILCAEAAVPNTDIDETIISFAVKKIPVFQTIIESQHALLAQPDEDKIRAAFSDVDIVHIYMPFFLGTTCARIAHEMGLPVLGCYHISAENITFNAGMRFIPGATAATYAFLRRHHYNRQWIQDIHCPSRCIASTAYRYHYTQSLHIISNGYDPAFRPLEAAVVPEELSNRTMVISVGRLTSEKRQDVIIKAVAKSRHKKELVLVLAGKGPKREYYEKLAKKLKVKLVFTFLSQQELINMLNCAYLFVQASDVETESISCLEAIACGTVPIISNARMCATKQFSLNKHSLFSKGSAGSLANRIDFWMEHKDLHDEMKSKYADFAKRFSLQRSIDSILEVYQKLLQSRRGEYTIRDYNNPLSLTVQLNDKGKPQSIYRPILRKLYRLLKK
jgi:glycosyltransferase involved in cell wall biosynthesis